MSESVSDAEFAAVSALAAAERYTHLIKRVADREQLWSLRDAGGWVLGGDDAGVEAVPVWPAARYAVACATGAWEGREPAPIALAEWMETWLPGMARDGRQVAVFPIPAGQAVIVDAERFQGDLRRELEQYE